MEKIKFEIGKKIPSKILEIKQKDSVVATMLMNNEIAFIISDCRNEEDAKNFQTSTIKFDICRKNEVLFFIINIVKLGLEVDAPYNINLTANTKEDMEKGIKNIYIIFTDKENTVKAIRGMELIERTSTQLGNVFIRQIEDGIYDENEYTKTVFSIYKNNPKPSDLLKYQIMNIRWRLPN